MEKKKRVYVFGNKKAESVLKEYNNYASQLLSIHEAVPGHCLQGIYNNKKSSDVVRSVFQNGAMIEGWAVYAFERDGFINIDITDTGKGVSKNNFEQIFEPGFSTKKRGWGLGLTLARRIIEEYHHGKIFVKESSAKGTTFRIILKAAE